MNVGMALKRAKVGLRQPIQQGTRAQVHYAALVNYGTGIDNQISLAILLGLRSRDTRVILVRHCRRSQVAKRHIEPRFHARHLCLDHEVGSTGSVATVTLACRAKGRLGGRI